MSSQTHIAEEVRRLGSEYGHELAAALMLASENAGRELKRQMARLVLHQIEAAVLKLTNASFPAELTEVYERGARQGVREELMKSEAIAAEVYRRAA